MGLVTAVGCGTVLHFDRPRAAPLGDQDWAYYGGDANGDRFSPLSQINAANVGKLQPAWRIGGPPSGLQTTPLIIAGILDG